MFIYFSIKIHFLMYTIYNKIIKTRYQQCPYIKYTLSHHQHSFFPNTFLLCTI
ncbi:uncharacterized protein BX663DRAFT_264166 [Cokeromyces recurvatus]|uniref:uncharacterized protein n=1 Tax=Cokeromyces recurvatus TaxID=90255 RepID=UPI0022201B65|nr:uncharacterized protein BX663DRAFT_264166 [Cokeromyces recurvatus]KAI7898318.1 hypothetical protein BX663DRAFT_264166 [Cokeromyces recurvatus]